MMNAKLFLKNNMPWCTAYDFSNSSINKPEKTLFTIPKSACTRKSQIPALKRKDGTPVQTAY